MNEDLLTETAKAAPPVTVSLTALAGVNWNTAVLVVTFIYIVLQAAHLIWKWCRDIRRERKP